jgi:hypothetical protein
MAWEVATTDYVSDPAYQRIVLNLVTEISFFLQQELWYNEMEKFENLVAEGKYLSTYIPDAFATMKIKSALNRNDNTAALEQLGSQCFPTYAKARDDLMSMWNTASMGLAAQKKGSALTYVEQHQARVNNPIPDNIGCQYASEVMMSTLKFFLSFLFFLNFLISIVNSIAPIIGKRSMLAGASVVFCASM